LELLLDGLAARFPFLAVLLGKSYQALDVGIDLFRLDLDAPLRRVPIRQFAQDPIAHLLRVTGTDLGPWNLRSRWRVRLSFGRFGRQGGH
jgi:hypothetical protein